MTAKFWRPLACCACLFFVGADQVGSTAADKRALAPLQSFVGAWKGVGQPKRGSNQGAWIEQSEWAWSFDREHAALVGKLSDGKYYSQLRVRPADKAGLFVLEASPTDGSAAETFAAALDKEGTLTATADKPRGDSPARISLRLVASGDRLVVLYERQAGADQFERLAEVGSTRKGSSFAKGTGYPECVVTGGRGTMAVEYQGQKYYVCCTGCRDLFKADPEGVLAEYRQRKAKEKESRPAK